AQNSTPMAACASAAAGRSLLTPRELDERLREAVAALRAVDWQMGNLLNDVRRRRIYRRVGCARFEDYLRDRVGIAPRTARVLMAADRAARSLPMIQSAY